MAGPIVVGGGGGGGTGIQQSFSPPQPQMAISTPQPHPWIRFRGGGNEINFYSGHPPSSAIPSFSIPEEEDEPVDIIHRYNSEDIIYEEPKKEAKIVAGRYLKGETLGEGSYSKVKEMLDCVTLCRRAVKIMKQRRLKRIPNGELNVQGEIKILKKLHHHNVIELVDVFEDTEKQKLYVVLEYCVGGLQEMLDKAPGNKFPVWQSHKYFIQLIDGLEYLHSRGVVHKDIKPGNLLLTTNEIVKICDFGVAEELDQFNQSDLCSTCQGSPAFQPPEIASGQDTWSGYKADIWASGVTLFHFTTGKFPFEGDNVYKLFSVVSTGIFTIPQELPPLLQDLIKGMLHKQADNRLSIPEIRKHSWYTAKHAKPLKQEIVRFPPYVDSFDSYRGTTVLPYLESFYSYGGAEGQDMLGGITGRWDSQDEEGLFDVSDSRSIPSASQSLASVSHERSMDTISLRKSRVSSQENVLFPISKSVDELGVCNNPPKLHKKRRKSHKRISEQCTHQ